MYICIYTYTYVRLDRMSMREPNWLNAKFLERKVSATVAPKARVRLRHPQHGRENDGGLRHIMRKILEEEHDKEEHVLLQFRHGMMWIYADVISVWWCVVPQDLHYSSPGNILCWTPKALKLSGCPLLEATQYLRPGQCILEQSILSRTNWGISSIYLLPCEFF